jgi:hypothetical protein
VIADLACGFAFAANDRRTPSRKRDRRTKDQPMRFTHPCRQPWSRRDMLLRSANGFGAIALAGLLADEGRANQPAPPPHPLTPRPGHHAARASRIIFLYMDGGPSQVDTFDPKPLLSREHGQPIRMRTPPDAVHPA